VPLVVGREQAALAAGEDLVREEAERAGESDRSEHRPAVLREGIGSVRRVLEQGEAVLGADRP
jgi:hypothetical protein